MLCFKLLIFGLIVKVFYKYAAKILLFFHIGNYYLLKNVEKLIFVKNRVIYSLISYR